MNRQIDCLSEAKIGDTIQFKYFGGTTPGMVRTIDVVNYTTNGVTGKDHDRNMDCRSFCDANATEVYVVNLKARVKTFAQNFLGARAVLKNKVDMLTGEQLAEVYATHCGGINPRFNAATHCVEFDKPVKTFNVDRVEMTAEEVAEYIRQNA